MSSSRFSFLTVVPRGLQDDVSKSLKEEASRVDGMAVSIANDSDSDNCLDVLIWNEQIDQKKGMQAIQNLKIKEREKVERSRKVQEQLTDSQQKVSRMTMKENRAILESWIPPGVALGSFELQQPSRHQISLGYLARKGIERTQSWSCGGQLPGSVWMQLDTKRTGAYQSLIYNSRCLGPLLGLVTVQADSACLRPSAYHSHSLEDITTEISRLVHHKGNRYTETFETALQVWKDCVKENWRELLTPRDYQKLNDRISHNRLRFRLSCIRQQETDSIPGDSTEDAIGFRYSRKDLCRRVMKTCGRDLAPDFFDGTSEILDGGPWTINLTEFDIELVIVILPVIPDGTKKCGTLAIGISLRPYPFLKRRSFACGSIPPDVTPPNLEGSMLSGVVKLRSTTAHLLLEAADLKEFDVVLDPCAGIGTIPLEADRYYTEKGCLSLGGDLSLSDPTFSRVAQSMNAINLMVAWDAASLPLSTSSIDVIVSDLPFGQQCLSVNSLNQFLPLLFRECARVLEPGNGRMVLLCGSTPKNFFANLNHFSSDYWEAPAKRVSPVSIGGLLAWIIRLDRNAKSFELGDITAKRSYLNCVRKLTSKREEMEKLWRDKASSRKRHKKRKNG